MNRTLVKLGELAETSSGGTPSRGNKSYYGGKIPWIKSGELPDGEITVVEEKITQLGLDNSSAKLLPKGTLVIAMYGATVGKLGTLSFPAATNQAVCAIIPGERIDRDYLYYWLLSIRKNLIKTSFGGAQPNISQTVIRELEIPLYPLGIQRQITARLKAQLAEAEKARQAAYMQKKETSLALNQIIESQLLGAIDKGTQTVSLGNVTEITAKIVNPGLPEFSILLHVSAENIEGLTGRLINIRSACEDGMTSGKYLFDEGDILYSKLRPYLRKVARPDFRGLCSADMYPIKCDTSVLHMDFLKLLLTSNYFTDYANEKSARSRMPKLNREQLFEFEFKLPPLSQQKKCIQKVAAANQYCQDASTSILSISKDLELLPSKILSQAFEAHA